MTRDYVPPLRFPILTPAYDWVVRWSSAEGRFRPMLVELVAASSPRAVLEIGCGTGSLCRLLGEALPGARVTGLDADRHALSIAARKSPAARLVLGDARAMPLARASQDAVVASLFFHHLDDDGKARVLGEIRRVLCPSGRLLIGDWDRPRGFLPRLGFRAVSWLDGAASTRAHAEGRFPELVRAAGYELAPSGTCGALAGTLGLWEARPR